MYTWLDVVFIIILVITIIVGLVKGFVRQIIGILAAIGGVVLAVSYYSYVSEFFFDFISHRVLSDFLGFLSIFLSVLGIAWLISYLLSKLIKGPLKFFDRALGGALGILKGILICVVIVFALLVFPINKDWLRESQLAPHFLRISQAAIHLIPKELKEKFNKKKEEILKRVKENEEQA